MTYLPFFHIADPDILSVVTRKILKRMFVWLEAQAFSPLYKKNGKYEEILK